MTIRHDVFLDIMRERVAKTRTGVAMTKAEMLRGRLFKQQDWFIHDPHRFKVLLCPRRSGKSYALAAYILLVCLRVPRANCMFIAQTRDRAKDILWEIIKRQNAELELGIKFSEVYLSGRFPNGSRFRLSGCETKADVEKYRGEAYHVVLLDECGSHSPELLDLLLSAAIEPTLADHKGTLVLAGTPGHILAGPFYRISGDPAFEVEKGKSMSRPFVDREDPRWKSTKWHWSFHGWGKKENVTLPHLWDEAQQRRERNNWTEQHPTYIREDIGRWIADDSTLCYRFLAERNTWKAQPGFMAVKGLPPRHTWKCVLGCDLGSGRFDKFALEVVAYSDTHPNIYHVYEFVATDLMSPNDMAREILKAQVGLEEMGLEIEYMVGDLDQLGESIQKQWRDEFGIVVQKAVKKDKRDHIELLNGDLVEGRSFILDGSTLSKQMTSLAWDDTGIKEKSGQRNDAADAFVYTWRRCRHRFFETPAAALIPGTTEYNIARENAEVAKLSEFEERQRHPERFTDNPGDEAEWRW